MQQRLSFDIYASRADRAGSAFARLWQRMQAQVSLWDQRSRERAFLRQLSLRSLADMGLTPAAAEAEASKPFWRA